MQIALDKAREVLGDKGIVRVADLLIGTGAVVIWCMPVFIVIYVLAWFLGQ